MRMRRRPRVGFVVINLVSCCWPHRHHEVSAAIEAGPRANCDCVHRALRAWRCEMGTIGGTCRRPLHVINVTVSWGANSTRCHSLTVYADRTHGSLNRTRSDLHGEVDGVARALIAACPGIPQIGEWRWLE